MLEIMVLIVNTATLLQELVKHSGIPSLNVCMNCHKSIYEYKGETSIENTLKSFMMVKLKNYMQQQDGMMQNKNIQVNHNQ